MNRRVFFHLVAQVVDNIFKNYMSLTDSGSLGLTELPADSKKRAEHFRRPEIVEQAEKIATDWLSIIERV